MAVTTLGFIPFEIPLEATIGDNSYNIRGRTEVPSSNRQWGDNETARNFENTPWARNGDSAALASIYPQYAFLADPAVWSGSPPAGATYVLPGTENSTNQGLLYYQGDGQLHYTRGTTDSNQKILLYLGGDKYYYEQTDENGDPVVPQPPFNEEQSPLPGSGWIVQIYRDYNAEYVRYDEDGNVAPAPQPYQKRDEDGNPIVAQPYQRHDENNNPV